MSLWPGLVSITFRQLTPAEIVGRSAAAGLRGIEWGGDVHVPHGQTGRAREVRELTRASGLNVAAYGSYYRLAESEAAGLSFNAVLDSAGELDAPVIRVWAGQRGSTDADTEYRARVEADARRVASLAAKAGINIAYEWHGGTLTDTNESAAALLAAVQAENLLTCWQPAVHSDFTTRLKGLQLALPRLANLHVFQWRPAEGKVERRPLSEGAPDWRRYLQTAATAQDDRYALLEFVPGDDPELLLREAAALRDWLAEI